MAIIQRTRRNMVHNLYKAHHLVTGQNILQQIKYKDKTPTQLILREWCTTCHNSHRRRHTNKLMHHDNLLPLRSRSCRTSFLASLNTTRVKRHHKVPHQCRISNHPLSFNPCSIQILQEDLALCHHNMFRAWQCLHQPFLKNHTKTS